METILHPACGLPVFPGQMKPLHDRYTFVRKVLVQFGCYIFRNGRFLPWTADIKQHISEPTHNTVKAINPLIPGLLRYKARTSR